MAMQRNKTLIFTYLCNDYATALLKNSGALSDSEQWRTVITEFPVRHGRHGRTGISRT